MMGFPIIKYSTNAAVYAKYAHRNTASDNRVRCERKVQQKGGVKERRISSIYTLNFETKNILSERALS